MSSQRAVAIVCCPLRQGIHFPFLTLEGDPVYVPYILHEIIHW